MNSKAVWCNNTWPTQRYCCLWWRSGRRFLSRACGVVHVFIRIWYSMKTAMALWPRSSSSNYFESNIAVIVIACTVQRYLCLWIKLKSATQFSIFAHSTCVSRTFRNSKRHSQHCSVIFHEPFFFLLSCTLLLYTPMNRCIWKEVMQTVMWDISMPHQSLPVQTNPDSSSYRSKKKIPFFGAHFSLSMRGLSKRYLERGGRVGLVQFGHRLHQYGYECERRSREQRQWLKYLF